MFGVRTALIILGTAFWAGTLAPAFGDSLPCEQAVEVFSASAKRFAGEAPPSSSTAGSQPAEEIQNEHADHIARERAKVAAALKKHGARSIETARARIRLAAALRPAAQLKPALEELELAEAALARIAPGGIDMAMLLRERGLTLSNMRKREESVAALSAAVELHAGGPARNESLEALNSQTLSDVLRGLSRFDEALKALNRAQAIYDRDPKANAQFLVDVLVNKFIILTRLGDNTLALEVIGRAVSLSEGSLGLYHGTTARALHNNAIAFRRAGSMSESFATLGKVYAIYTSLGNKVRASEALDDVARTLARIGCMREAIDYQGQSLQRLVSQFGPTHVRVADAETWLGKYIRDSGDMASAAPHFSNAVAIFDELLGPDNVRTAITLRELAAVQSRAGQRSAAVATLIRSIRGLEQGNAPDELRESLHMLAQILKAEGNVNGAILFAKKAVNTQQEIRAANRELPPELSASLAQRYRDLYLYLADLLIEQGRLEEAQRVIDLIKSQEMIDFVRGGRPELLAIDGRAPMTKTERKTLSAIDELLNAPFAVADELEKMLALAKKKPLDATQQIRLDELKAAFNQNYKSFQQDVKKLIDGLAGETAAVQGEIVQLHLDMLGQTRKKLKQFKGRAILLQIASLDDQVHIFVTGTNTQVHRTAPVRRAALAKMAFEAWSATAKAETGATSKLATLYDVLIRPVEKDLADSGADVVMLNLEGFLRYIPFAALHSGKAYLIEDYALTMQTPAADTQYAVGARDRASAVGFGVTDALRDFSGLPGVAKELETIFDGTDNAGVFAGSPFMNGAFNADGFALALESRPQFVHIASHFKLEPGDETKSFLLLGTGDALTLDMIRTDPRFQFADVDLLTLSACETAGEVGSDGKEVESFATLAQASGASSVMATLWPIADESTAELMAGFYTSLLDQQLDKATALRLAQVEMIREGGDDAVAMVVKRGVQATDEPADTEQTARHHSHPYYWSAFILMGNWL